MDQRNKKKNKAWRLSLLILLLCCFIFTGSGLALAADTGVAEAQYTEILKQIGVAVDEDNSVSKIAANTDGAFLGYVTISVEKFVLGEGYIVQPYAYPLYEGVNIADIVEYVTAYASGHPGSTIRYTATGTTAENFMLTGVSDPNRDQLTKVPDYIKTAIQQAGGSIGGRVSDSDTAAGDIYKDSGYTLWINNQKVDKSYSDYTSDKNIKSLKAGDVIRIQFSLFGDGREMGAGGAPLLQTANKDQLTARIGEINSWYSLYLNDSAFKTKYDAAVAVLGNLFSTQAEVDAALQSVKALPSERPAVKYGQNNMLMGNSDGLIAVGGEFEITAMDVPRAADDDRNFTRKDLNLEVVQGKNCVAIRQAPGIESGATGNSNRVRGAAYFVKGLKQGVAMIKVSVPGYKGRDTYVVIHISNNENDRTNPVMLSSDFDYVTKYDTINYTDDNQMYPITVTMRQSATATAMLANGTNVPLAKSYTYTDENSVTLDQYTANVPLRNGYNTVILTATLSGKKTTKVYNLRASYTMVEILNKTNPGAALKQGDTAEIKMNGLVIPLPKISRLYNPSMGQVRYKTDLPRSVELRGTGGGQYDIDLSTITMELTGAGDVHLFDGALYANAFGGSGWAETPKSQLPSYRGRPVVTTGGGGGNAAQHNLVYSFLPDITFHVEENPDYQEPADLIQVKTDKETYASGETVNLTLSGLDLNYLRDQHKVYISEKEDPDNYYQTTAITQSSVVFYTDIPGMETVRTVEFKDFGPIRDDPNNGLINNYAEGAPAAKLEGLHTLSFTVPDGIPSGDYTLRGGYVDVEYGPWWWTKYLTYYNGKINDIVIHVENSVLPGDADDDVLTGLSIAAKQNMVYPAYPQQGTALTVDPPGFPTEFAAREFKNWQINAAKIEMNIWIPTTSRGILLTYPDGAGGTVEKTLYKSTENSGSVQNVAIPLHSMGENTVTITCLPKEGSTLIPRPYTFYITRGEDPTASKEATITRWAIASASADGQITPYDDAAPVLPVEDGKFSYSIDVNHYVDKIYLGVNEEQTVPITATLNGKQLSLSEAWASFLRRANQPLSRVTHVYPDALVLNVGENVFQVDVTSEDGKMTNTYTFTVNRLPEAALKTAEITPGTIESGGFAPGFKTIKAQTAGDAKGRFAMAFTATEGAVITRELPATADNIAAYGQEKINALTISSGNQVFFDAPDPILPNVNETPVQEKIYVTRSVDGQEIVTEYMLEVYRSSDALTGKALSYSPNIREKVSSPDYQDATDTNPDNVFRADVGSYTTNLGLFGGYAEYKLDKPIENDINNRYGIDFTIYGNATNAASGEPGSVQVAQDKDGDGQPDKWYTLAGSQHYSDSTIHDYELTYDFVAMPNYAIFSLYWANSQGDFGTFPPAFSMLRGRYPGDAFFQDRWNSTIQGTRYTVKNTLISGNAPAFGYADVHPTSTTDTAYDKPVNPYRSGNLYSGAQGDGFDLSWAVDDTGEPVQLDSVSFVRAGTAVFNSAAMTELSTDLSTIVPVTGEAEPVGKTGKMQSLKINGAEFPLQDGVYQYEYPMDAAGSVTFSAITGGANFYVNEQRLGNEAVSDPIYFDGYNERVVRLILQSDLQEPAIYTFVLTSDIPLYSFDLDKTALDLKVGETAKLNVLLSPYDTTATAAIHWMTTSSSVATVVDGSVTAVNKGTCTITAQLGDRDVQCTVTVAYAKVGDIIALIDDLPAKITAADEQQIAKVRMLYGTLTSGEQAQVTNIAKLTAAEAALHNLKESGVILKAGAVISLINDLPRTITVYDETAVKAARTAYAKLEPAEAQRVTNYNTLVSAERALKELQLGQDRIESVIYKIGQVSDPVTLKDKTKITAARLAYDALTSVQQAYVSNYEKLAMAETAYTALYDQTYDDALSLNALILTIPSTSLAAEPSVLLADLMYAQLTAEQQALVTNYSRITTAKKNINTYKSLINMITANLDKLDLPVLIADESLIKSTFLNAASYYKKLSEADRVFIPEAYRMKTDAVLSGWDEISATPAKSLEHLSAAITAFPLDSASPLQKEWAKRIVVTYNHTTLTSLVPTLDAEVAAKYQQILAWYNQADETSSALDANLYLDPLYAAIDAIPNPATKDDRAVVEYALKLYTATPVAKVTVDPAKKQVLDNAKAVIDAFWTPVDAVVADIAALPGSINVYHKATVEAVRAAYEALALAGQKDAVSNYTVLQTAEGKLAATLGAADSEVAVVKGKINAIPSPVTLTSRPAIHEARSAYQALSIAHKSAVDNYDKLKAAETDYDVLLAAKNAADAVILKIKAIGSTVTLDSADAIKAARISYEALSPDARSQVTNVPALEAAEAALAALVPQDRAKVDAVIAKIAAFPPGAHKDAPLVIAARAAYNELSLSQKQLVTNVSLLLEAEAKDTPTDITVSFRLIGDSRHEVGGHEKYVNWIKTVTYTFPFEEGETLMVYDVFMKAVNEAGLTQTGAETNYVSAITAPEAYGSFSLAEFNNGPNSGWMYTINGVHPNVGLKECPVQNGDAIVWHYIDDYKIEETQFTWLEAEDLSPAEVLAAAKTAAKEELATVLAGYDEAAYSAGNWQALLNAKADGDALIDSVKTIKLVGLAKAEALSAMDAIDTLEEQDPAGIEAAKTAAKEVLNAALAAYNEADYSAGNWQALLNAKADGDDAIDAVIGSVNEVNAAKEAALSAMADIKTLAEENQELDAVKAQAKADLNEAFAGYNEADYSAGNWQALLNAKADGDAAIDAVTSGVNEVNAAKEAALSAMAAIKTLAEENDPQLDAAKAQAKTDLNEALAGYSQDDYTVVNWKAIHKAKTDGDAAIDAAVDIDGVNAVKEAALQAMAAVEKTVNDNMFIDVRASDWFYSDVAFAVRNGIFKGTTPTTFSPGDSITRAQFVTILGRYVGITDYSGDSAAANRFRDVDINSYYGSHLAWAVENGIVNGTSPTTFAPDDNISRQDMATMIARFAAAQNIALPDGGGVERFADDGSIAAYADDAVYRMKAANILNGKGNNAFVPKDFATRAEAATIMHRLVNFAENN